MAVYSYKARASDGKLVSGRAQGDTIEQVAQRLISGGNVPIDIHALGVAGEFDLDKLGRALGLGRVQVTDLVLFSRQMYTITRAGIPLLRGTARPRRIHAQRDAARDAGRRTRQPRRPGAISSTSFGRHPEVFPTLYVSIVRVGEATGTLEKSFQRLTEYLAQEKDMQRPREERGALSDHRDDHDRLAAMFLSTFVIPKFAPVFAQLKGNLPLPTTIMLAHPWSCATTGRGGSVAVALLVYGFRQWLATATAACAGIAGSCVCR